MQPISLSFLHEYLFMIPLIVALLSEIAKVVLHGLKTGEWHEKLFQPGAFPSSHSAFVVSLLIIVERKLGIKSTEFAIAFVFGCLMWYDAMSSRKAIGDQAKILNKMQKLEHLKERLGHSFKEVVGGIAFGTVVTYLGIWVSETRFFL